MNKMTILSLLFFSTSTFAAVKTYQVTGPILEMSDATITVDKNGEKWEISKDATTQIKGGELKKGQKVTIKYSMMATEVEVKGDVQGTAKDSKSEATAKNTKKKK